METLEIKEKIDKTICVKDAEVNEIEISKLEKCFVYVLKEIPKIKIENCSETTIFIAKTNEVTIENSKSLDIICFTETLEAVSTKETKIFTFATKEVFIKKESSVILAPYNCCVYAKESIIPSGINVWDKPRVEEGSSFALMEPSEFNSFVVPFGDEPKGILAPLPAAYSRALQWRERVVEERRQLVMEFCKRAPSYAKEIQDKISNAFKKQVLDDEEEGRQVRQLSSAIYL